MASLPVESVQDEGQGPADAFDAKQRLQGLRLRLVDAAADLRPLPSLADMADRVQAVASELDAIMRELPLVVHVTRIEEHGLHERLQDIDRRLDEGWIPQASPVEDVVARLRESMNSRAAS